MSSPLLVQRGREAIDTVIAKRRLRFRFMKHEKWENALFVHWPVDPLEMEKMLPKHLVPDLFNGTAWVGLVLLTERGVGPGGSLLEFVRYALKVDHLGANVRTYVRRREGAGRGGTGDPGIYFFSLECSSAFAAFGARVAGIPYFFSSMSRSITPAVPSGGSPGSNGTTPAADSNQVSKYEFSSTRLSCWSFLFRQAPDVSAKWSTKLPVKESGSEAEGWEERARWFVERYSVYAAFPLGNGPFTLRGDVTHPKWPLEHVELEELNAAPLLLAAGFSPKVLLTEPHVCFSPGVGPIEFWMLEPL
eukprot:gnl/MRDRNA2_/MRDRNA2_141816_c0_seq1.p1 gnl/MRDRNA2_/MRDRNA2_141816_c0~~gnl/MRDRNA2_/MRDRNA2_141816_c0_seq1.p1  ORF type:complete len:304 (-),score=43.67 gnl/MRDRNA2_/MRDRNA2_141816_c0_seq1:23-934(-)